ncbi:hypothetical protein HMPREF0554_0150 [Pseudoleptotrichia goodfellowii F0264]|uniref:Uncharacterized protein n=1 Tax=Pseudoleptotrichia goodfellowii F0264 TaxID=596323 RepID=D0GIV2_9FUSO|nr:hypothetical protein HMPREF0554_0150 [Pseudoleptotrichia goodfellowii F0264]
MKRNNNKTALILKGCFCIYTKVEKYCKILLYRIDKNKIYDVKYDEKKILS